MNVPDDWKAMPLGQLVKIQYGKAHPREERNPEATFPVVGSAGVMSRCATPLVKEPCLVIGRKGNVGQVTYCPTGAWPTDTTYFISPPNSVLLNFLHHLLVSLDLRRLDSSTATPSLRRHDLENQIVKIPPLAEQRRIVEVVEEHLAHLDAADAALASAEQRVEAMRTTWIKAAFSKQRDAEIVKVGDVLTHIRGGWSRSSKHFIGASEGTRYVKMNNIRNDGTWDDEPKYFVSTDLRSLNSYSLKDGDILFNSKNSIELVGKSALVNTEISGAVFNENIMRLRFNSTVLPEFAHLYFLSPGTRELVRAAATASTNVAAIYQNQLQELPLWVPSIEIQKQLVDQYSYLREASGYLRLETSKTGHRSTTLRRAVLAAAFSGQLTKRTDPSDLLGNAAS